MNALYEKRVKRNTNKLAGWCILAFYLRKPHGSDICQTIDIAFNSQEKVLFKALVCEAGLAFVLSYSTADVLRWLKAGQVTKSWASILLHW